LRRFNLKHARRSYPLLRRAKDNISAAQCAALIAPYGLLKALGVG
jgi:hypothetical protein